MALPVRPVPQELIDAARIEPNLCRETIKILRKEFTDAEIREMLEFEFAGEELGYELNRKYRSCFDTENGKCWGEAVTGLYCHEHRPKPDKGYR